MSESTAGDLPAGETVLLAAFEGWNDAGAAATQAVAYLADVWDAEQVDELDPEEYHDFQVNRPVVGPGPDGTRQITWPTTAVSLASAPHTGRPVVMVHGIEPSMRWRRYCTELLDIAVGLNVRWVVTLGALLADVPHTRPLPISATSEHEDVAQRFDLEPSRYEGATGIVGVLADAASQSDLAALSCWAAVPHYAGGTPSPKATLGLIAKLEELLDLSIPHGDLAEETRAWEHGVDEMAESDDEVAEYIQSLEQAQDTADLPEASGDAIAREFERYLRRRGEDPPTG